MSAFLDIVRRDLRLALRQRADAGMVVLFFALTVALFPFGIGTEPNLLARIAPGVIWVTALLAVLLSLERLFLADYEDGSLELLALSPLPLELTVVAKAAAHWLTPGLPLIAAAPLIALLYNMDGGVLIPLLVLPLYIPVLIFGVSTIDAGMAELNTRPHLLFLGAIFLFSLAVAPFAGAAALRQALE